MRYRRAGMAGGTYFLTVNLYDRKQRLLVDHIDLLREAVRKVKAMHPFEIDSMVVLPGHPHAVWTLPPGDADYPTRWALIKAGFSPHLPADERRGRSRLAKGAEHRRLLENPSTGSWQPLSLGSLTVRWSTAEQTLGTTPLNRARRP